VTLGTGSRGRRPAESVLFVAVADAVAIAVGDAMAVAEALG
jgi:hypothetical protein